MLRELKGLTVAITASRGALELAHIISNLGGIPHIAPTVRIVTKEPREEKARIADFMGGWVSHLYYRI